MSRQPITEYGKMACCSLGFAVAIMPHHARIGLAAIVAFIVFGMADVIICDRARRGTE